MALQYPIYRAISLVNRAGKLLLNITYFCGMENYPGRIKVGPAREDQNACEKKGPILTRAIAGFFGRGDSIEKKLPQYPLSQQENISAPFQHATKISMKNFSFKL
jgi:hypothetical protein